MLDQTPDCVDDAVEALVVVGEVSQQFLFPFLQPPELPQFLLQMVQSLVVASPTALDLALLGDAVAAFEERLVLLLGF